MRATRRLWPALLFLLLPRLAAATTLEQVLLFLGEDHARLLLVLDEPCGEVQTRSTPAVGQAPARASVLLPDCAVSPTLLAAYRSRPGGAEMPVDQRGIRRLVFTQVGEQAQVAVELDRARTVATSTVAGRALLVDLRVPSAALDQSLPDPELLASWMNGLSLVPTGERRPHDRPRIVVDPGHGGWDPGAVGCTGTRESDLVLALARRVKADLEDQLDADVVLTRETDIFLSLQERAALANSRDADLFVSIHANAAPAPTVWGIETYYLDVASDAAAAAVARRENQVMVTAEREQDPTLRVVNDLVISGTSALSRELANDVHSSVIQNLQATFGTDQIRDLGVKSAMFYVLVSTRMPSILFEASFLTHPEDEMRLRTPAFQRATSAAIVAGIGRYLEATAEE